MSDDYPPPGTDDWNTWRRHVLYQLSHQDRMHSEIKEKIDFIAIEMAGLKVRAGLWGAMAGVLPGLSAALYLFLR